MNKSVLQSCLKIVIIYSNIKKRQQLLTVDLKLKIKLHLEIKFNKSFNVVLISIFYADLF